MNMDRQDGRLMLRLPSACTIAEVEAAADKLRGIPEEVTSLEIDAGGAEEMDTAYFQLLLALKATMDIRSGSFVMDAVSPEVRELCGLYGVRLEMKRMKDEILSNKGGQQCPSVF